MAVDVDVVEAFKGRTEVVSTTAEHHYLVIGADNEGDVTTAAQAEIPTTYGGYLVLDRIELAERLTEISWRVVAYYVKPAIDQTPHGGDPDKSFTFDTGSETQHITQSLQTVGRYGDKASPNSKDAIGYDGDTVQGLDIPVPAPTFTETHYFTDVEFTAAYKRLLMRAAWKTNNAAWRGWVQGEVLFMGATGNRRGDDWDDPWEVTFKFGVRENKTGLTVGDISGIAKKGWQYLDIRYKKDKCAVKNEVLPVPKAVYVHRVFEEYAFANLGIDA